MSYNPAAPPAPVAVAAPLGVVLDVYSDAADLNQVLSPEQRLAYQQNRLTRFNTTAFVLLTIVTFGLFGIIYHMLKNDALPVVKSDDPGAGKALAFVLIPYLNIFYGVWVMWPRLIDRVNFQYRLRGRANPLNRSTAITALILTVTIILSPVGYVMMIVMGAKIQSATNALAEGRF